MAPLRASTQNDVTTQPQSETSSAAIPSRRDVLIGSLVLPLAPSLAQAANAAEAGSSDLVLFENDKDKYKFMVPSGWEQSEGMAGTRKVVAFHPADRTDVNVTILITLLAADFTGLGSFGTVDAFGETLVNGLDRSWQKKPGQKALLLKTKAMNDSYYIEYTLQKPDEPRIHLFSVVTMGRNGWYSNLYTFTGQYPDEEGSAFEKTVDKIVKSFRLTLEA